MTSARNYYNEESLTKFVTSFPLLCETCSGIAWKGRSSQYPVPAIAVLFPNLNDSTYSFTNQTFLDFYHLPWYHIISGEEN